jgi:hypothetical protein
VSSLQAEDKTWDGALYDLQTDRWRPIATEGAPSVRRAYATVWTGQEFYVWGGTALDLPLTLLRDGAAYNPRSNRWRPLPDLPVPLGAADHAMVWTGREVLIWGGSLQEPLKSRRAVTTGLIYRPDTDTWGEMSAEGQPPPRDQPLIGWDGAQLLVWGGSPQGMVDTTLIDGGFYDPVQDRWSLVRPEEQPSALYQSDGRVLEFRGYGTAILAGQWVLVWGGSHTEGASRRGGEIPPRRSDGVAYDLVTGRPRELPPAGLSARRYQSAVWTGQEMIIWGGDADRSPFSVSYVNDGARYLPPC